MREKFVPFIKLCALRLFRLPGQSLLGLAAGALALRFLRAPRLFNHDM